VEFTEEETPIHTMLADNEFQTLREDIERFGINVNIVSNEEHVPEFKHQNKVTKERLRATI
jgi:hypothetical protein